MNNIQKEKLKIIMMEMNSIESIDQLTENFFKWRTSINEIVIQESRYFGNKNWTPTDILDMTKDKYEIDLTDTQINEIIDNTDNQLSECNETDWLILQNGIKEYLFEKELIGIDQEDNFGS